MCVGCGRSGEAAYGNDRVGDGRGLTTGAGGHPLRGGQALGCPPRRVEGEFVVDVFRAGEAGAGIGVPGPGAYRAVVDDQEDPAGSENPSLNLKIRA